MSGIELIPSAKRMIMSLRDLGYDFSQAVADIIDNSIAAHASEIDINVEFDGDDSWVSIADNGDGMTDKRLREALRYGSEREYEKSDLGKFGLGLKTASLSQCQRLSVASRNNANGGSVSAYTWDLDHITKNNRWEILPLTGKHLLPQLRDPLHGKTGTVVFWQRLDRILGYRHPYGALAKKRLLQMCREVELHLAMVFHQFLSGNVRRKRLKIRLNGNVIRPWDPFCQSERKTRRLSVETFQIEHEGNKGIVRFEPFILPTQNEFSTPDAFRNASGPMGWNQQQGFYFYRAERMIQSGGWSKLRAPDEHTKYARIAVHFPPALDDAFKINVAKMRVQLPAEIRDLIEEKISAIAKQARAAYDRKESGNGAHPHTDASSDTHAKNSKHHSASQKMSRLLTLQEWADITLGVARGSEKKVIKAVIKRII